MKTIDFRSDTLTRPSAAMLEAMVRAEVGDDVYGEDPTVNRLERMAAEMLGMEDALFVPSGTMGNLIALRCHTRPGDEVVADAAGHTFNYETGGAAGAAGVQIHPVAGEGGMMSVEQLKSAIRPAPDHFARTSLLTIENTHNAAGGRVWPIERLRQIVASARAASLAVHVDGARLFNAAVALGVEPRELLDGVDSVSVCLSKGLGAPIGSVLAGDHAFIHLAHRMRKMLGGGMRQAGVIAAAGIFALDNNVERLAEDHERARRLAKGLAALPGWNVDPADVETNMVLARTDGQPQPWIQRLAEVGIVAGPISDAVRFVSHLDIDDEDIDETLRRVGEMR